MMSEHDKANYHNIIREMIKNEDEVRNSRNNWFMAIQGFLVAGTCELTSVSENNVTLIFIIAIVGLSTSLSFGFAAWRSERAVAMALACWDIFLIQHKKVIKDYPPINLLTEGVINYMNKNKSVKSNKRDKIEKNRWEKHLYLKMYNDRKHMYKRYHYILNKLNCLMPFKLVPKVMALFWILLLLNLKFDLLQILNWLA